MIIVRVIGVSIPEVARRRPHDHVGRFRGRRREQGRPLEADGQREGRGGAQAGRPPVVVYGSVSDGSGQPER